MNKKRKIILLVILILLILLLGIGIFMFISYSNSSSNNISNNVEDVDDYNQIDTERHFFDSYEDVIAYLESNGIDVTFLKAEDDFWYFKTKNNSTYKYCVYDGTLVLE